MDWSCNLVILTFGFSFCFVLGDLLLSLLVVRILDLDLSCWLFDLDEPESDDVFAALVAAVCCADCLFCLYLVGMMTFELAVMLKSFSSKYVSVVFVSGFVTWADCTTFEKVNSGFCPYSFFASR